MLKYLKILPLQIFYLAHTISMAAMEILGWPLILFGLTQLRPRSFSSAYRKTFFILIGISAVWLVTQLIHLPGSDAKRLVGGMSWVLLLWGLFGLFIKMGYETGIKNLSIILWTLPLSAGYALYQMFYGWDFVRNLPVQHMVGAYYRAIGFFNMPLTFSYVLGLWGAMALGQAAAEKRFSLVQMLAIFSGGICVLTSLTRGSWVAFSAVLVLAFFFFNLRQKIYVLLIAGILTAGFLQNTSLLNRVQSMSNITTDQSNSQRLILWKAHIEIFKDHPFVGVGYGQTEKLLPEYYKKLNHPEMTFYSYAHNIYIQALASGGLIGALCLYSLHLFFLWAAWKLYKREDLDIKIRAFGLGSVFAQIYFNIGGLTENNFYDGEVLHSFILVWALTFATYIGTGQNTKTLISDTPHR